MLWFKNAIIYQLNNDTLLDKNAIEKAIKSVPFTPCGNIDTMKMGWVSPYNDNYHDDFIVDMQGHLLLRIKKETKLLPAPVIKQALLEKIDKQEQALSRKLTKNEKATLKDEVMIDLMPRAFSKYNHYWLWIDTINKRIILDTSSFKQAEDILAILRKELGVLALTPLSIEKPVEQIMTTWVKEKLNFAPFILGDQAELKDPLEGNGIISCKNQDITSDEMMIHFDSGKWITKVKIIDERGVNFIVNNDLTLKRIKFDSSVLDENEDIGADEFDKKLEADFFIMANLLSTTINDFYIVINKIT
ncbi:MULTISPECIES: recombination-associated protein RdgC [unclassified Gilliamella]|uniref:recombination-associated protein RdgC n=1 Tax=unclassified Gilliamella TaxID=2685620 RepID=UPI00226A09DA|nr:MULTISPECIES: recombination-associated protein RdgC [unclassified Gilliamella]MCX8574177.1 recombination-associated protein RdgC [Gilliamella sp. B3831]MCX8576408.1 recombination-associated protein RdgC [Gilliamella sp. B3815]MCX8587721.1 recombination-associated protein RdgC [Gilliamella sp. B3801]MCX8590909.1 recombination-associated protein RdgC [Gilliamella sp. B3812]MCX8591667.1 recombination-associated protein RdgC [Gilliamella sp. B3804]